MNGGTRITLPARPDPILANRQTIIDALNQIACTCDPELTQHGIRTIGCPAHGLAVFMRESFGVEQ